MLLASLKWLLISVIIGGFLYELLFKKVWLWVYDYFRSIFVVRRILKQNRQTRNGGGKYTADRMLDIWNNENPMPLVSRKGTIYMAAGRWKSVHWENVIDEILEKENLVVRYEEEGRWLVRLADNQLTKYVMKRLLRLVDKGIL